MTLFSYKFKKLGWILVSIATILALLYFTVDFRFKVPVFAVLSSFAETKYFTVFKTNFADESILLLYVIGFFIVVFTKEKTEKAELNQYRVIATKNAVIIYFGWMLFSVLFFYGTIFIAVLILNIILPFIIYLILFKFYIRKLKSM
jgi:hypothetical protein